MAKRLDFRTRRDGPETHRAGDDGGTIWSLGFSGNPLNGTATSDFLLAQTAGTINGLGGDDLILGDIGLFRGSIVGNNSFADANDLDSSISIWSIDENPLLADDSIPHMTIYIPPDGPEYFKLVIGAGQTVTIDIDGGDGTLGSARSDTNTLVHLYLSTNTTTFVARNDNDFSESDGFGSTSGFDSLLTFTNTGASALYYIQVIQIGRSFEADDEFLMNVSLTGHAVTTPDVPNADTINGGSGDDHLFGAGGNDVLTGGSGIDLLHGGSGNDQFGVDSAADIVIELAGEGDDTILTSASYFLAAGVSVETIAIGNQPGTTGINLTGNEFGQSIFGNEGNNQLLGLGGTDQLVGYGGNDVLVGGAGIDYLRGGLGNDVYGIGEGDIILEVVGEGDDSLAADIGSYFLNEGASIESLSTANQAGTFAQNLTGNDFGQSVSGSEGANVLNGGLGNDLLRGYGGADIFLFDTTPGANNHDVIADMVVGVDKIALQNSVFTGLAEGNLGANAFVFGTQAIDANDRIIWNAATKQLFYDADGTGAGAQVLVAIFNGSPNLTASDFIIV